MDYVHPPPLSCIRPPAVGLEPKPPQPIFHSTACGFLSQCKGQYRARFDVAVEACIDNHRRGAKRTFGGLTVRVKFDLRGTTGALADAGFFHLGSIKRLRKALVKVQLCYRAVLRPDCSNLFDVATVVTL